MASKIVMPKLSDTMVEGQFGAWRKHVGDRIERGEVIAEIETDKAIMELESFSSGVLLEMLAKPGDVVPIGTVIGLIGEPDEVTGVVPGAGGGELPRPEGSVWQAESSLPPEVPVQAELVAETESEGVPPLRREPSHDVQAAPVVRRRAAELGVDLNSVQGSGPNGRIMLEDLERLAPVVGDGKIAAAADTATSPSVEPKPLSRMRRAIARTTVNAWQNIPHFYLMRDIEMERAEEAVRECKARGEPVSLNGLIMASAVAALVRFPALNTAYCDAGTVGYPHINLAFAVAGDEMLQMPVIKGAEQMGAGEISEAAARLAGRARKSLLTVDEISGASFSVSNLGMFGVDALVSIIAPGQAAILALGTVAERPAVHDGHLAAALTMTATLSCDHRIVDGALAAAFLNEFKQLLENPDQLRK